MDNKKEKINPLGTIRRTIWFVLRAVLLVSLLLGLAYAVFTEAMYISNMYIIVTEGMELRAETILKNGGKADLDQHFTEDFLNNDALLNDYPYGNYLVDNFDYRYEIKGVSVLPWASSGSITYEERVPVISGSPVSDDVTEPMPAWESMIYTVNLKRIEGRWLIDSLTVVERNPEDEVLPTPDYSQLEDGKN